MILTKLQYNNLEDRPVLHQSDILPRTIKQRHLEPNAQIIFFGLSTAIPDGSSHVKAYFETDTNKLKLWNGTAWVSTTLS